MKNSNRRIHFLTNYREHLSDELDKMNYGQSLRISSTTTVEPTDRLTGAIVIVAMVMIFSSIFLVQ